jgi:hypothetical protein
MKFRESIEKMNEQYCQVKNQGLTEQINLLSEENEELIQKLTSQNKLFEANQGLELIIAQI